MADKTSAINTKLAFDGEKEYKENCKQINQSLRVLGSEMKVVTAEFKDNEQSSEALKSKQSILNKMFEEQTNKVAENEKALETLRSAENQNTDAIARFEIALNKSKVEMIATSNELKNIEKSMAEGATSSTNYKDSVSMIDTSLATLQNELKQVSKELNQNSNDTVALGDKTKTLTEIQDAQKQKVDTLREAYEKSIKENGRMSQETQNLKSELSKAEKELSNTGKELSNVGVEAEKSGGKLKAVGDILGGLAGGLAKGIGAIGVAGAGLGTALAGATIAGGKFADDLITQSTFTRQSTDDLQKYAYAAQFIDVEMDTLTNSMGKNIKSMSSAQEGTGAMAEAYKTLGVSVTNADGSLKDSNDVYWETIDALGQVSNETERDAMAMQLLGKSGTELNSVINAGSKEFKKLGDEAVQVGAVMSGKQLDALGSFDDKMNVLNSSIGGLKNSASLIALPFLDVMAGEATGILANFSQGINNANGDMGAMSGVVSEAMGGMITLISEQLPVLIEMGTQMLTSIISGIVENLPTLVNSAMSIITMLCDTLINLLPMLIDGALQIIMALAQGIGDALPQLIPKLIDVMMFIIEKLVENIPLIIDCAIQIIEGLALGIIDALPMLIEKLPEIIISIVNGLIEGIPKIIESADKILVALIEGLIIAVPKLIEAIPKIIMAIVMALANSAPKILESGNNLLLNLADGILRAIPAFLSFVPKVINYVVEKFGELKENISQIGGNIVQGVWDGIKNMGAWFTDQIKSFFGGMVDSVKETLGIKSPSRVFADEVGAMIPEGTAKGIEKTADKAVKAAEKMAKDTYTNAKTWIDNYRNDEGYLVSEELKMWETLGQKYTSVSKEKVEIDKNISKLRDSVQKESFDNSKSWIEKQKFYNLLSAEDELNAWTRVASRYKEGTKEKEEADRNLFTAKNNLLKDNERKEQENFNNSKKIIDTKKNYGLMSLKDEVKAWESIQKQYVTGSKLRQDADNELLASQKRLADEQTKIQEKMVDAENKYKQAVESKSQSIYNSFGLFDELKVKEDVTASSLSTNLENQVTAMREWANNLTDLKDRGISKGLLEELQNMGPKASEEIKALASMSDTELSKYSELWSEKHYIARSQSVVQLAGLREDTNKTIKEMTDDINKTSSTDGFTAGQNIINNTLNGVKSAQDTLLNDSGEISNKLIEAIDTSNDGYTVGTDTVDKIKKGVTSESPNGIKLFKDTGDSFIGGLGSGISKAIPDFMMFIPKLIKDITVKFASFEETFNLIGTNIVDGIWKGIENKEDWLDGKLKTLFDELVDKIKKDLGIESPSKVFAEIGGFMADGTGVGFVRNMKKVQEDINNSIPKKFDIDTDMDISSSGRFRRRENRNNNNGGVNVVQNIYGNQTDYAKQQKEAKKQMEMFYRGVVIV